MNDHYRKDGLRVEYKTAANRIAPDYGSKPKLSSRAVMCFALALILAIAAATVEVMK